MSTKPTANSNAQKNSPNPAGNSTASNESNPQANSNGSDSEKKEDSEPSKPAEATFAGLIDPQNSLASVANKDEIQKETVDAQSDLKSETIAEKPAEETDKIVLQGNDVMSTQQKTVQAVTAAGKSIQPDQHGKVYLFDTKKNKIIAGPIDIRFAERQVNENSHLMITTDPSYSNESNNGQIQ